MALAAVILSTVAVVMWLSTLLGVAYVLWRYAYTPWLVMRKDITALNQKTDDNHAWVKNELGLRSIRAISDEEIARAEAAQRRSQVWSRLRGVNGPGE